MRDFGGIVERSPARVVRPASPDEVVAAVREATAQGLDAVPRGTGHSTFGQSLTTGVSLDLRGLSGVHENGERHAAVAAGTTWREVLAATLPPGLVPPVLTDHLDVTVGGTISAGGVGGTSHLHGTQADNVLALDVVADGALVTCSPPSAPTCSTPSAPGWAATASSPARRYASSPHRSGCCPARSPPKHKRPAPRPTRGEGRAHLGPGQALGGRLALRGQGRPGRGRRAATRHHRDREPRLPRLRRPDAPRRGGVDLSRRVGAPAPVGHGLPARLPGGRRDRVDARRHDTHGPGPQRCHPGQVPADRPRPHARGAGRPGPVQRPAHRLAGLRARPGHARRQPPPPRPRHRRTAPATPSTRPDRRPGRRPLVGHRRQRVKGRGKADGPRSPMGVLTGPGRGPGRRRGSRGPCPAAGASTCGGHCR